MKTAVKAHARKGTRGVRRHLRIVPARGPPFDTRLVGDRLSLWISSTAIANTVMPENSERLTRVPVMFLTHKPVAAELSGISNERLYLKVLPHESLHLTLEKLGEQNASLGLDRAYEANIARWYERHPKASHAPYHVFVTNSGLHPKPRKRALMVTGERP